MIIKYGAKVLDPTPPKELMKFKRDTDQLIAELCRPKWYDSFWFFMLLKMVQIGGVLLMIFSFMNLVEVTL